MKVIQLVNSKEIAKVDDKDYPFINQFKWYMCDEGFAITYFYETAGELKICSPVSMGVMVSLLQHFRKHE